MQQKLSAIFKATRQHAKNLATYVTIYKTALFLLRSLNDGKQKPLDSFLAGLLGGYVVFGENNNINQQIVLYVFARVAMGTAKVIANTAHTEKSPLSFTNSPSVRSAAWPLFASLCWGAVMYLHVEHVKDIQPSLAASMNYLYNDSNKWTGIRTKLCPLITLTIRKFHLAQYLAFE